ncbi:MAG: HEAT repeat domain-containing protein [Geobacteraceae bacterium]|nr:HEAT repeat domain-containing protein [Geobacteraceae bacterium]
MDNLQKIDRSFKERQGVLHLLEKLKKENITYAEMDEIGSLIRKVGRSAVQPLLRRISHEKNGSLISKYTYLLDFLDDRYWIDQIVHIALKRRDLEVEGKAALLATLEDCGIDVTIPPFSMLLSSSSLSTEELFTKLIEKGEGGLTSLLEQFASMEMEVRRTFLLELAPLPDERIVGFLELLLWFDNSDTVKEVIAALGRVRAEAAASVLLQFRLYADQTIHSAIDQSLKRLSFVGVNIPAMPDRKALQPFHSAYASPVDGNGFRNIVIARWREDGNIDLIDLHMHDINGVEDVCGETSIPVEKYEERSLDRAGQELIEPVAPEFALELLRDGLLRNRESEYPLPPEFMLRRTVFDPLEITPAPYIPPVADRPCKATPAMLALSNKLFEDEFFSGWAIESALVYDIAEEWLALEKSTSVKKIGTELERLIERLCKEEFKPKLVDIARRITLNADYLSRTGGDDELVKAALAAAGSIREFSLPCHLHPFLRRFAMESMIVAREALEEGYDIRDYEDDWE